MEETVKKVRVLATLSCLGIHTHMPAGRNYGESRGEVKSGLSWNSNLSRNIARTASHDPVRVAIGGTESWPDIHGGVRSRLGNKCGECSLSRDIPPYS